ncbi:MAG: sigma-70 family RNA polymerase sigma factor [Gammaproteobacteria bacterium]
MSSSRDADSKLVERVKNGEKAAFDLLVLKYQSRIVNLVSRFVRNPTDALDVTQEAFIKAYLAVQARRPAESDQDIEEIEQIEGENALKEQATPEHMLLTDEIQRTVVEAIEKLPDDLRTAITLREVEGLSYEEIAAVMECPIGTVRSRIFRAREAIDKELNPLLH